MGIILDPAKSLIHIAIYYVEEVKKHGHSIYHFIHDQDDFDNWRSKGYVLRTEAEQHKKDNPINDPSNAGNSLPHDKYIETINTTWKRANWKEQNHIFSQSLRIINSESEIDPLKYRDLILKTCLKKWDVKDDNGNPIPCNPEMIDNLDPEAAKEMISAFERVTESQENK